MRTAARYPAAVDTAVAGAGTGHPAGTCTMGLASDLDSVAAADGKVHGIDGLYVADASLLPAVTSGNTSMPATPRRFGGKIAGSLPGSAS